MTQSFCSGALEKEVESLKIRKMGLLGDKMK